MDSRIQAKKTYEEALRYLQLGEIDRAEKGFLRAQRLHPAQMETYFHLCRIYCRLGRWQDAKAQLVASLKLAPGNFAALLQLGKVLLAENDLVAAGRAFAQAHRLRADHPDPLKGMAQVAVLRKAWGEARELVERIANLPGQDGWCRSFAEALEGRSAENVEGRRKEAARAEEEGMAFMKVGEEEDALDAFGRALDRDPHRLQSLVARGRLLQRQEHWEAACADLSVAMGLPGALDAFGHLGHWLGEVHEAMGNVDVAIACRARSCRRRPDDLESNLRLLRAMARRTEAGGGPRFEDLDGRAWCEALLEKARSAEATATDLILAGELFLLELHEETAFDTSLQRALQYFQCAYEVAPENPVVLSSTARVFEHRGELDKAARFLERLVELRPADPDGWERLWHLREYEGDTTSALDALERLIALDVENGAYRKGRILLLSKGAEDEIDRSKLYRKVRDRLQTECYERPSSGASHLELGYASIYLASESVESTQAQSAEHEFKMAMSVDPDNLWAHFGLKDFYCKLAIIDHGYYEKAIDVCQRAVFKKREDGRAHFELAQAYNGNMAVDMKRLAEGEYRKALELDPDDPESCFELAKLCRIAGRKDEAIRYFDRTTRLRPVGLMADQARSLARNLRASD